MKENEKEIYVFVKNGYLVSKYPANVLHKMLTHEKK